MVNAPPHPSSRLSSAAHQGVNEYSPYRSPNISPPAHQPTNQASYSNLPNFYPRMQSAPPPSVEPFLSQAPYQQQQQQRALAPPAPRQEFYPAARQPAQGQQQFFWDPLRQQAYTVVPPEDSIPTPPPPPPVHRVYHLRCASCETFLSDRGMRAVLLLKPHIVLFSTDARPSNTDTFWPDSTEEEQVERTCECLTSSLNCNGCGRTVGYNIVSPCVKCNASVQKHQRSANHHRFVFHHNEVRARERSYYHGEKGVLNPIVARGPAIPSRNPSPAPPSPPQPTALADSDKDPRMMDFNSATRPRLSPTPGINQKCRTLLKAGDTVYWHHLVPGGERAAPIDPRTREPVWAERDGR